MDTVYDVRNILKRFGIFVYTGNRIGDLELMEAELQDLYKANFIDVFQYQNAVLILKREMRSLNE